MSKLKVELIKRTLPQNPKIEVFVPNYKEPILPVIDGGFGWLGLQSQNEHGQLMCQICMKFRNDLTRHIHEHKLSTREYRLRFQLMLKTELMSAEMKTKYHNIGIRNIQGIKAIKNNPKRHIFTGKERRNNYGISSLQYQNKHDTCKAQLIRALIEISRIYGRQDISTTEIEEVRPGLSSICWKRFGSLNKAKQLAKLVINEPGIRRKFPESLILDDMCTFYLEHDRWPHYIDYINHIMICKIDTIYTHGGLKILRQKALPLLEEKRKRINEAKRIPQITGVIELQFAGRGRR